MHVFKIDQNRGQLAAQQIRPYKGILHNVRAKVSRCKDQRQDDQSAHADRIGKALKMIDCRNNNEEDLRQDHYADAKLAERVPCHIVFDLQTADIDGFHRRIAEQRNINGGR